MDYANTTYYFNIKAVSSAGTSYGTQTSFTTSVLPLATTSAASGTTATASTLNGSVNVDNSSTTVSLRYSTTSPTNCSGSPRPWRPARPRPRAPQYLWSAALSALSPGTEYFFQIEAVSSAGTTYGSVLDFPTPAAAPTATTNAATSVGGTAATLNGSANAEGASTTVTYCYSTSSLTNCVGGTVTTVNGSTPTLNDTTTTAETPALTALTPNTEYFFQIKAVNSVTTTMARSSTSRPGRPRPPPRARPADHGHRLTLNGSVNAEN